MLSNYMSRKKEINIEAYYDQWKLCIDVCIEWKYVAESQARAAMLIHLLENNLMQLPDHWRQDLADPCPDGRCHLPHSPGNKDIREMPAPAPEETNTAAFNALWDIMRDWHIQAPRYYTGTREATGRHVKLLLDAIYSVACEDELEILKQKAKWWDELDERIGAIYGNEEEDNDGDLLTIGEIAASALGYL